MSKPKTYLQSKNKPQMKSSIRNYSHSAGPEYVFKSNTLFRLIVTNHTTLQICSKADGGVCALRALVEVDYSMR